MNTRRMPMWGWVGLAAGCGVIFLCVCTVLVGGGWYLWQRPTIAVLPAPAPTATPVRVVNRIAYQGVDGNIHTIAPDGSAPQQLTTDGQRGSSAQRLNRTPTWSPDGRHLAYVKVSLSSSGLEAALHASAVDSGAVETLHSVSGGGPFYLYWAPDSRQLAFLEAVGQTIALRLTGLGQTESRELSRGSPYYYAWSPDSQRLLTHVNGHKSISPSARVSLFQPGQTEPPPLNEDPGVFLAPDWSPDGQSMVYARRAPNQDEVIAANADGTNERQLLTYNGSVSFAWSPRGDQLGYIITPDPLAEGLGLLTYGQLGVTNIAGGTPRTLSQERALAFFWSPDGTKIAYLTLTTDPQGGAVRLHWIVVEVATGEERELAVFDPSEEFVSIIPFFDQYARSLRVWSPDSRSIVYSVDEGNGQYGIYVVDVAPGSEPRRVADGVTAAWSWQ